MQLQPFRLDMWLDNYEHDIEFNLCSATAIRKPRPGPPQLHQGDESRSFIGYVGRES